MNDIEILQKAAYDAYAHAHDKQIAQLSLNAVALFEVAKQLRETNQLLGRIATQLEDGQIKVLTDV